jgi:broad specificity phosphatase PhoE
MLVLARHGRTAANVAGQLLGHHDPPLDDEGRRQAAALASALTDGVARVARVVASPLTRTRETAEAIAVAAGVPLVVDDRWIELDYGDLDGLTSGEVPTDVWAAWRADPSYVVAGGESLDQLGSRVARACEELTGSVAEDDPGDVVVVSHVSPIKAAVAWTLGVDQRISWRLFVALASITRIDLTPRGPVLRSFNETAHLPVTS